MYEQINEIINSITKLDAEAMAKAKEKQQRLAKPPRSLGLLEDISIRLSGITGKIENDLDRRRILVLCSDNGITEEDVSSAPDTVTLKQAINMTKRKTGMSVMAKAFGDDVSVVDVGIKYDYSCPDIVSYNVAKGTKNFLKEDALNKDQCLEAITIGAKLAKHAKEQRMDVIGVGEMGIGNTTTSTAVLSVLSGIDPDIITGKGGGLTDEALEHKKWVIKEGIKRRNPNKDDVIDVLSKLGGLDIAAMCGVFLGCAKEKLPVVIDGYISAVAALCAYKICPLAKEYMFPSHESKEPGYLKCMEELDLKPYLSLNMRLGEGSGCVLAFEIMQSACTIINDMALFNEDSNIDDSYLEEIRKDENF